MCPGTTLAGVKVTGALSRLITPRHAKYKHRPAESSGMRCWLVERDYDDKGLVRLVYATPGGEGRVVQERSAAMLGRSEVTAAIDVDQDRLEPVDDPETRERYATEADRVAARYDPDDAV